MKKISFLLLIVSVSVSCSKNNPTDEEHPQNKNCKTLSFVQLIGEGPQGTYYEETSTFYYDSQNRVSKIEKKYKNTIKFGRFTYESNTIKYSEDDLDVIYTLNNKGLIINTLRKNPYNTNEPQVNYSYNSSNQLALITSEDDNYFYGPTKTTRELIYENGNLVKIVGTTSLLNEPKTLKGTFTETFSFTKFKAPIYNSAYLELFENASSVDDSENLLYSLGYFGITSKNMVESMTPPINNTDNKTRYYDAKADQNGNVIEVIPNSSDIYKYNYQCE